MYNSRILFKIFILETVEKPIFRFLVISGVSFDEENPERCSLVEFLVFNSIYLKKSEPA